MLSSPFRSPLQTAQRIVEMTKRELHNAERKHVQANQRLRATFSELLRSKLSGQITEAEYEKAGPALFAEVEATFKEATRAREGLDIAEQELTAAIAADKEQKRANVKKAAQQRIPAVARRVRHLADAIADVSDKFRLVQTEMTELLAPLPPTWRSDFDILGLSGLQRLIAYEMHRLGREPGGPSMVPRAPAGIGMYERQSDGYITPLSEIIGKQLDALRQRIAAAPSLLPTTNETASLGSVSAPAPAATGDELTSPVAPSLSR